MKKVLYILISGILAMMSTGISAQDKSSLEKFYKELNEKYVGLSCHYTLRPANGAGASSFGKVSGNADVEMQDDAYIFRGNGLTIISDGKIICVMDEYAKEAVYESVPADLSEADYLQNPAYLIRGLEDNFKILKSTGITGASSAEVCDNYVLEPVVDCGIRQCCLYFKAGKEWLSKAVFELSDGNILEVEVYEPISLQKKHISYFTPKDPSSFEPNWIITDLR